MEELKESPNNYSIGPNELLCCYERDYQKISDTLSPEKLSSVSSLRLSDIEFDDECMVQFAICFSKASCRPSTLDFSNNRIGIRGAEILSCILRGTNNHISTLSLYRNTLGDKGTYWISSGIKNLTNLNLAHNEISDVGVEYLCNEIKTSSLSLLSLAYNNISSHAASALIYTATELKDLSLVSNLIDCRIILRVKQKIMNLTAPWTLSVLSLFGNHISNTHKEWNELKKTIKQSPLCSLLLEECLRPKAGNPELPPRAPQDIYRLSESFLIYAVNIDQNQLEMHSPFEQVVLLTLLNNPNFAKTTLVQLHKLMSNGSQYKNFYTPLTFIPYEIENLLQSEHFHICFWEKKVNEMQPSHPYLLSLEKIVTMLNSIQSKIGLQTAYHTRFFSRLKFHKNDVMNTIEL